MNECGHRRPCLERTGFFEWHDQLRKRIASAHADEFRHTGHRRSLLNFDIDVIPTNAAVVSAGLSLYSNPGTAYAADNIPLFLAECGRDQADRSPGGRIR